MDERELKALNEVSKPLNAMDMPNYFKLVLFGDYGVGKTVWASMFGKTHVLAADQGIKSVKNFPNLASNIDVSTYQGPKHWKLITKAICEQAPGYECDTFVIDTMSHIQEQYVSFLLRTSKYDSHQAQRAKVIYTDKKAAIDGDPMELPGSPDWNRAKFFFNDSILSLCRDFPGNVIFIAHEREPGWMEKAEEKKGNRTAEENAVRPSITESLFKVIAREVDLIGFMEADRGVRTISFAKTRNTVGKSRLKELSATEPYKASEAARILNEWRYRTD